MKEKFPSGFAIRKTPHHLEEENRPRLLRKGAVSAFRKEMEGIYCSCIGPDTLDEAPFAYRSMNTILEKIKDTVEVTKLLKPIYNFKAGNKK